MAWSKKRAKRRIIHLRGFHYRVQSRSTAIWEQYHEYHQHRPLGSGIGLLMLLDPETGCPIGAHRGLKQNKNKASY